MSVRGFNGAGLFTTVFGSGIAVDYSPPVAGYLHDGPAQATPVDIDFQVRSEINGN